MGVHRGLVSPRNGDYVALAVHQAARVPNAGLTSDSGRACCQRVFDRCGKRIQYERLLQEA
jgi:hypothetical protein